jgi:hypothetical protein
MATGLATFMDGYNTFMESKSGEFWKGAHCRAWHWSVSHFGLFTVGKIAFYPLANSRFDVFAVI